jgi:glucuronoarabinoxylan endo-1,4-beta-xylanase
VAIVALNTATSPDPVTFTLAGTGIRDGSVATPYLTDAASDTARQPGVTVHQGAFTMTLPARSMVSFVLPGRGGDVG